MTTTRTSSPKDTWISSITRMPTLQKKIPATLHFPRKSRFEKITEICKLISTTIFPCLGCKPTTPNFTFVSRLKPRSPLCNSKSHFCWTRASWTKTVMPVTSSEITINEKKIYSNFQISHKLKNYNPLTPLLLL